MKQYLDLMRDIVSLGEDRGDRTGVGTRSLFGAQLRFDLAAGFPLLTTKKIHFRSVVHELIWFLRGDTNIKYLKDNGVSIWDEWANEKGEVGPLYGKQWRSWEAPQYNARYDQIEEAAKLLKNDPESRRNVVSAWNVPDLPIPRWSPQANVGVGLMALAPCHCLFQFYASGPDQNGERKLSCHMYQRSCDYFLGAPFNIASYALLTMVMARHCGMGLGDLIISFGDVHLYQNHLTEEIVYAQLGREPRSLPQLRIVGGALFNLYRFEDFELVGYYPHPSIKAPIAV